MDYENMREAILVLFVMVMAVPAIIIWAKRNKKKRGN